LTDCYNVTIVMFVTWLRHACLPGKTFVKWWVYR